MAVDLDVFSFLIPKASLDGGADNLGVPPGGVVFGCTLSRASFRGKGLLF